MHSQGNSSPAIWRKKAVVGFQHYRAHVDLDLAYMPAPELAHRIRRGELSPVEIVRNALEREWF
jgi:hypothetical protein